MGTKFSKSSKEEKKWDEFKGNVKSLPENFDKTSTLPASFRRTTEEVSRTGTLPRNLNRNQSFSKRFRKSCKNWAAQRGLIDPCKEKKEETHSEVPTKPSSVVLPQDEAKDANTDLPEVVITKANSLETLIKSKESNTTRVEVELAKEPCETAKDVEIKNEPKDFGAENEENVDAVEIEIKPTENCEEFVIVDAQIEKKCEENVSVNDMKEEYLVVSSEKDTAEESAAKVAEEETARVARVAAEEAKIAAEAEEARVAEETAKEETEKIAAEKEAAKKAAEEEAAMKAADEEAVKQAAEEEAARKAAKEEAAKKAAEEEAAKKVAEEEAAMQAAEEEAAKKAAEEEAAKKAAEEEAVRQAAEEEAAKRAAEEEAAKKAAEEEAAKKAEEEEAANQAAKEEAAKKAAEEEAAKKAAEEEAAKKAAEEEEAKQAAEERAQEEAAMKEEEEEAANSANEEKNEDSDEKEDKIAETVNVVDQAETSEIKIDTVEIQTRNAESDIESTIIHESSVIETESNAIISKNESDACTGNDTNEETAVPTTEKKELPSVVQISDPVWKQEIGNIPCLKDDEIESVSSSENTGIMQKIVSDLVEDVTSSHESNDEKDSDGCGSTDEGFVPSEEDDNEMSASELKKEISEPVSLVEETPDEE